MPKKKSEYEVKVPLGERELAAVMAGLRLLEWVRSGRVTVGWRTGFFASETEAGLQGIMTNLGLFEPLRSDEIDELCYCLNNDLSSVTGDEEDEE